MSEESKAPMFACDAAPIEAPDPAWRRLIDSATRRGLPIHRLAPDQAEPMALAGLSPQILRRLQHGYPGSPARMGTLTLFPPLAEVLARRSVPGLFYLAEALQGERAIKRRLRASLADLEEGELSDEALDGLLLKAATLYLDTIGNKPAVGQDGGHRFWLPGAEAALSGGASDPSGSRSLAIFGPLMPFEDFRSELERRLMVARLWGLIGVAAAVLALSRSGDLSSRLLVAFAAFGILGAGLGLAPLLRANARIRELLDAAVGP